MSAKELNEAWDHMTDEEKEIMGELWMKAENHDGHAWITYGDFEKAVGTIILGRINEKRH